MNGRALVLKKIFCMSNLVTFMVRNLLATKIMTCHTFGEKLWHEASVHSLCTLFLRHEFHGHIYLVPVDSTKQQRFTNLVC